MAEETKSSSAGEDTDTDGVQKRVEQEGREARNVISWRVPNELSTEPAASSRPPSSAAADESAAYGRPSAEPPQPAEKEDGNAASPPTSASGHSNAKYSTTSRPDNIVTTTSSSKGRGVVGKRAGKEGSGAGRAVAVEGAAMTKAAKDKQEEKEASRIRRFFSLLFRNLNRSVDELFWVCEAESSMDHSSEAAALLESCARDFHKVGPLIDCLARTSMSVCF